MKRFSFMTMILFAVTPVLVAQQNTTLSYNTGNAPVVKTPNLVQIYPIKEMIADLNLKVDIIGETYTTSSDLFTWILGIMKEQMKDQFPREQIRYYAIPSKQVVIILAPQKVHDAVGELLENLDEVFEVLKQIKAEEEEEEAERLRLIEEETERLRLIEEEEKEVQVYEFETLIIN